MNAEIEKFKHLVRKNDFETELGFSFFKEELFKRNENNGFFLYKLKNQFNKILLFTYYPCGSGLTSNEIDVAIIYPNGNSTTLSSYLAYKQLNRKLKHGDVKPYRFKVDCENLEQSIQYQLQKISNLLHGELKKFLISNESIVIPIHDPRDEY